MIYNLLIKFICYMLEQVPVVVGRKIDVISYFIILSIVKVCLKKVPEALRDGVCAYAHA